MTDNVTSQNIDFPPGSPCRETTINVNLFWAAGTKDYHLFVRQMLYMLNLWLLGKINRNMTNLTP
jgi:hypothetical protein